MIDDLTWLGHSGFRLDLDGTVVYIDPFHCAPGPEADVLLITHDHFDHFSPDDVKLVLKQGTEAVAPAAVAGRLSGRVHVVKAGDTVALGGFEVTAVAAYNTNKFRSPGQLYHPPEAGGVGYVIDAGAGRRLYHAGDSDVIPEMDGLGDLDVALLPVSGVYVMTASEAAEAARRMLPAVAVPMHWGEIAGSVEDARDFARQAPVEVRILEREL